MQSLELEIKADDGLSRDVWYFYFDDRYFRLYVDSYSKEERQSKRHGFKIIKRYSRLDQRNNSLEFTEVPLSSTVKLLALELITKKLDVRMWEEDHPK